MGRFSWKTRGAAILSSAAAAALIGTTPAHAYKLDDGKLEVKGLAFLDFTSVDTGDNKLPDDGDTASGFHFKRAYFEMRYHPEKRTTYRITLDAKGNDQTNTTDGSKNQFVFVKYAYAQIEYVDGQSVKFGLSHTPVVDYYQTHIWGHRYVAKTFVDDVGAYTSSDLGVSLLGTVAEMVDYQVSVMNGEGYTKGSDGNGFSLAARVEATAGPAKVGLHGHTETDRGGTPHYDVRRGGAYVDVAGDWGNAAAEYLMADDSNQSRFKEATGYSALVNVSIPVGEKSKGFLRYDSMEFKDTDPDPVTKVIVGAETEVHKSCTLAAALTQTDPGGSADTESTFGIYAQVKI